MTTYSGLGVEKRFVGWGPGIIDFDNDGYPDLFMVTGGVYPEVATALSKYPMKTPRVVFRNLGNGKFEELIDVESVAEKRFDLQPGSTSAVTSGGPR